MAIKMSVETAKSVLASKDELSAIPGIQIRSKWQKLPTGRTVTRQKNSKLDLEGGYILRNIRLFELPADPKP
jgi:hypothetical protein